jgi:hypothetical protein
MQTPKVTEISALSAHRREAAVVRRSHAPVTGRRGEFAPGADRLRSVRPDVPPQDRFLRDW